MVTTDPLAYSPVFEMLVRELEGPDSNCLFPYLDQELEFGYPLLNALVTKLLGYSKVVSPVKDVLPCINNYIFIGTVLVSVLSEEYSYLPDGSSSCAFPMTIDIH